jgi:hypothetical protein
MGVVIPGIAIVSTRPVTSLTRAMTVLHVPKSTATRAICRSLRTDHGLQNHTSAQFISGKPNNDGGAGVNVTAAHTLVRGALKLRGFTHGSDLFKAGLRKSSL